MWGLSIQALQALGNWSLAVAGVAGVVAAAACLLSAVTSARVAELVRVKAESEIAQARQHAADALARSRTAETQAREAEAGAQVLARSNSELEAAITHDAPAADDAGVSAFTRRAHAFAALVQGRTPELALVVGHGPGAHAAGQVMRQALRSAGVQVRWCRLKPSADADQSGPADGLTVYADPGRPEAAALLQALTAAGFKAELSALRHADPGLPSPAIYFAAVRRTPAAEALATCNPVLGPQGQMASQG